MQEPSPLTGNHVAKELRKFLRSHSVPHSICNTSIVITGYHFKPCVLNFKNDCIRMHVINEFDFNYMFQANTLTVLFEKLMRFHVITERDLIRLLISKTR
jgi:hypothetical protein